ncbi:hypothetical protein DFJ73DRAFT_792323 [Zopfochytrium polystomum]|nr:hypothetical protein DFJ73DRAFT_792323 [Zopfochytrium polystomum]
MATAILIGTGAAAGRPPRSRGLRRRPQIRHLPLGLLHRFRLPDPLGGFEASPSRREAAQILGLREVGLSKDKLKEAHRRIMLLNHPDRGWEPVFGDED